MPDSHVRAAQKRRKTHLRRRLHAARSPPGLPRSRPRSGAGARRRGSPAREQREAESRACTPGTESLIVTRGGARNRPGVGFFRSAPAMAGCGAVRAGGLAPRRPPRAGPRFNLRGAARRPRLARRQARERSPKKTSSTFITRQLAPPPPPNGPRPPSCCPCSPKRRPAGPRPAPRPPCF